MSLLTAEVGIEPSTFHKYLSALDCAGVGYSLTAATINQHGRMHFELWADGGDHNGTTVVLNPDGTWSASTNILIGECK